MRLKAAADAKISSQTAEVGLHHPSRFLHILLHDSKSTDETSCVHSGSNARQQGFRQNRTPGRPHSPGTVSVQCCLMDDNAATLACVVLILQNLVGREKAAKQAHTDHAAKRATAHSPPEGDRKKPLETYVKEQAELAHYEVRQTELSNARLESDGSPCACISIFVSCHVCPRLL